MFDRRERDATFDAAMRILLTENPTDAQHLERALTVAAGDASAPMIVWHLAEQGSFHSPEDDDFLLHADGRFLWTHFGGPGGNTTRAGRYDPRQSRHAYEWLKAQGCARPVGDAPSPPS